MQFTSSGFQYKAVAAGVALAVSGGVNAGGNSVGADHEVIIGGATAPQIFLREDTLVRICGSNRRVFVDQIQTMPSAPGVSPRVTLAEGDHWVVRCTTKSTFGSALDNKDIAIYKYNGGSATGVAPVDDPAGAAAGDKQYLPASTTACNFMGNFPIVDDSATYELYECPNVATVTQDPDAGVSDVEPGIFTDALALSFGDEPLGVTAKPTQPFAGKGSLQVKAGPGLVFGVGVTLPMYDELLDDQQATGLLPDCPANPTRAERDSIACMPSLPSAMVKGLYSGKYTSWADFKPYGQSLDPANVTRGNEVHLCKRTNGSGTHAQTSVHFMGTNCRPTSQVAMLEQNNGLATVGSQVAVYANSGSSDMTDCLRALGDGTGFDGDFDALPPFTAPDTGDSTVVPGTGLPATSTFGTANVATYNNGGDPYTAYAVGYNSLEKNQALDNAWRFVKIDGAAPTLEDTIAGKYTDVYYLSFQNRLYGSDADPRTGPLRSSVTDVDVLNAYFDVWNNIAPAPVAVVNEGFVVDPDGVAGTGDEWQGGFVTPTVGASLVYNGTDPETPWSRQEPVDGNLDSCQALAPAF